MNHIEFIWLVSAVTLIEMIFAYRQESVCASYKEESVECELWFLARISLHRRCGDDARKFPTHIERNCCFNALRLLLPARVNNLGLEIRR